MIQLTLNDIVDVTHYYTTPDPVPFADLANLPTGDIYTRPGPSRVVIVLRDAQGNRAEFSMDGVAPAVQLREAATLARQWHRSAAEKALADD